MQLRPYQAQAIDDLRAAFRRGARSVLLVAPTGSGKTIILAAMALGAAERGTRLLILAHRAELIAQASAKLDAAGVLHGRIAPGAPWLDLPIQVGSVQTVARRLGTLPRFGLVALDEAHHAVAGSWAAVLDAQHGARVVGLTATPQRLDGRGLGVSAGGPFDALVLGPSVSDLISAGHLVPTRVFAPPGPDLSSVRTVRGDYDQRGLAEVVDHARLVGDIVEHYQRHAAGLPAIAFCASVQHAQHVAEAFRGAGIVAEAAHGALAPGERARILGGLGRGVQVVCAADLISEGLDVPGVGAVILARPTQSLALHRQQVGRGLRPAPGKRGLIVLDHAGNTVRHGFAETPAQWTLDGRKRRETPPAVRQCPACYCAHPPAARCPECGHAYAAARAPREAPRQDAGTLVEISRASVEQIRAVPLPELLKAARSKEDIRAIGRARGYHPGWAKRQIALRPGQVDEAYRLRRVVWLGVGWGVAWGDDEPFPSFYERVQIAATQLGATLPRLSASSPPEVLADLRAHYRASLPSFGHSLVGASSAPATLKDIQQLAFEALRSRGQGRAP